jgi:hypothetical protein
MRHANEFIKRERISKQYTFFSLRRKKLIFHELSQLSRVQIIQKSSQR